eukprot:Nitzschia sp. Nitz4//scaffold13_size275219//196144//197684//NITZ4_000898-RA/size275219-augustus-gene-0.272-mRNA-1//-1//CDS//3329536086//7804//frame0
MVVDTLLLTTSPFTSTMRNALGLAEASIMGESALIDRETGRVFWEGGSSTTLVESLFDSWLNQYGAEHAHAAILTTFITLALLGVIVEWLRQVAFHSNSPVGFPRSAFLWLIMRCPRVENKWVVTVTIILYLLESYTCSTRRFLTNSISSPEGVEEYIRQLREQQPVVTWSVRSFHYEKRRIFAIPEMIQSLTRKFRPKQPFDMMPRSKPNCGSMFPFTRKVVTNKATRTYQYNGCVDKTIAGVWKRQAAVSSSVAPFTKIILSKLLVLNDVTTREDYFRQQSEFVTEHGRDDEFTEFCTEIEVKGYRPTVLAVRAIEGVPSAKLFNLHVFWIFTLLGLTFPYRIWFKRHCDSLRVSVVKETISLSSSSSTSGVSRWMPSWATMHPMRWGKAAHYESAPESRDVVDPVSTTTNVEGISEHSNTTDESNLNDVSCELGNGLGKKREDLNDSNGSTQNSSNG